MTRNKHIIKEIKIVLFFLLSGITCFAGPQKDAVKFTSVYKYTFDKGSENVIRDKKNVLYPLFEKLRYLREIRKGEVPDSSLTVSIIHLGDSHIQADMLSSKVRVLFQEYFGNAGRGLIAPLRLTKTNESKSYRLTSDKLWDYNRLIKPGSIPIGIAGLGLQLNDTIASLSLETINESFPGEWSFNNITAFYNTEGSFLQMPENNLIATRVRLNSFAENIQLNSSVNSINLDLLSPINNNISFYGFNLSNGNSGVYYHAIGINSAKFIDYSDKMTLCEQVSVLNPQLIIISLGVNDAASTRVLDEDAFYSAVSDVVFYLRKYSPDATVLLTTPAEIYRRYGRGKRGPNTNIAIVRNLIIRYAETNGYPYWDLFGITGGKNSVHQWNKKKLLVRDGVHYTQQGYEFQGELLFEALMKSYNKYITTHPHEF